MAGRRGARVCRSGSFRVADLLAPYGYRAAGLPPEEVLRFGVALWRAGKCR
jgi:hypothetical protein